MARSLAKLLVHPALWVAAVRMCWRMRGFPDRAYIRFRMVTMYGDEDAQPHPDDLLAYLRWCKAWERGRG